MFGTKYPVVGFGINQRQVAELNNGNDQTLEVDKEILKKVLVTKYPLKAGLQKGLFCSFDIEDVIDCNLYVVIVPTPVDKNNRPDLTPLIKASETVGKVISKGDIVVYESTVYPGATEEDCIPVVEKISGLKFNDDFFCRV